MALAYCVDLPAKGPTSTGFAREKLSAPELSVASLFGAQGRGANAARATLQRWQASGDRTMFVVEQNGKMRFTSDAERARRLAALRAAMRDQDLRALVVCGRSVLRFRGRVLYVSDVFQYTADSFAVVTLTNDPVFVTTPVVGLGQANLLPGQATRVDAFPGREIGILVEHGSVVARIL